MLEFFLDNTCIFWIVSDMTVLPLPVEVNIAQYNVVLLIFIPHFNRCKTH